MMWVDLHAFIVGVVVAVAMLGIAFLIGVAVGLWLTRSRKPANPIQPLPVPPRRGPRKNGSSKAEPKLPL